MESIKFPHVIQFCIPTEAKLNPYIHVTIMNYEHRLILRHLYSMSVQKRRYNYEGRDVIVAPIPATETANLILPMLQKALVPSATDNFLKY